MEMRAWEGPKSAAIGGGSTPAPYRGEYNTGAVYKVPYILNLDPKDPNDTSILGLGLGGMPAPPAAEPIPIPGTTRSKAVPHLSGVGNVDGRYQCDPRVYGKHKLFPPTAARILTQIQNGVHYLTALFNCGYGELVLTDHKFGDKPWSEFEELETEVRTGTTSDQPITIYTQDVEQADFDEPLKQGEPIVKNAGQSSNFLQVDVNYPNGVFTKTTDEEGNEIITERTITVKVEYRIVGSGSGWTNGGNISTTAANQEMIWKSKKINVPLGLYEVQLTKTAGGTGGGSAVNWVALRAFGTGQAVNKRKDAAGNDIGTAWVAMRVMSQENLQGTIESYNNIAQSKLPIWNGTTWTAPTATSNPAAIFVDMLCGPWNKRALDRDVHIDKDSVLAFYNFCLAKKFNFNYVYDQKKQLWECLKDVCAVARATPGYTKDGKIGIVFDDEKTTPADLLTASNSNQMEGSISWVEQPDALNMRFVNPDLDWQQDERVVYADGKDSTNALLRETVTLVGVTDADHAWQLGRYYLAVGQLRRERYYLSIDFEHLRISRGDLVLLNHDVPQFGIGSGWIKSVQTDGSSNVTGITLDQGFNLPLNQQYEITVRMTDGTMITRNILGDGTGEQTVFVFPANIPAATNPKPAVGDLVAVGGTVKCLVENIEPESDFSARVTLVDYAPGVFTADTGLIPPHNPQITPVPEEHNRTVPAPVIHSVVSDESVMYQDADGSYVVRTLLNLVPANLATVQFYSYQWKRSVSDTWGPMETIPATQNAIYLYGMQEGELIDIQVQAVSRIGNRSVFNTVLQYFVVGKTTPPPDVPYVVIDAEHKLAKSPYDSRVGVTRPRDLAGFQWRMHWGNNRDWDTATLLTELVRDDQFDIKGFARDEKTFLVKAVDTSGNFSVNAATLFYDFGSAEQIDTLIEQHDFGALNFIECTITGGSVVLGTIKSTQIGPGDSGLFWSGTDDDLFYPFGPDTINFWNDNYEELTIEFSWAPPVVNGAAGCLLKLLTDLDSEVYRIEYQGQVDQPFWGTDYGNQDAELFWTGSNSDPFWGADVPVPWLPFPTEGVLAKRQEYKFRITAPASRIQTILYTLVAYATGILKEARIAESSLPVGGAYVGTGGQTFHAINHVQVSVVYDPAYPDALYARVEAKDRDLGPFIKVFDVAGNPVAGKVNVLIQGV